MGWIKLFVVCVVLYLGQSYYLLSSSSIERFLADHNALAMNDPVAACDNYSDDVNVSINHDTGGGNWEVEGGKDEVCGYIKQSQAALVVAQANTSGYFENMSVTTGFPWQKAGASYDEVSNVQMGSLGSITSKTRENIKIKRTLTGLQIVSVNSTGGVNASGKL